MVLNVFLQLFCITNGPNSEVIEVIPIFWVIFGQFLMVDPPGVILYMVTTCCLGISFEEILSYFVLSVFLWLFCIIKSQNSHKTDNFANFGTKMVKMGSKLGHFVRHFGFHGSNHQNNHINEFLDPKLPSLEVLHQEILQ